MQNFIFLGLDLCRVQDCIVMSPILLVWFCCTCQLYWFGIVESSSGPQTLKWWPSVEVPSITLTFPIVHNSLAHYRFNAQLTTSVPFVPVVVPYGEMSAVIFMSICAFFCVLRTYGYIQIMCLCFKK